MTLKANKVVLVLTVAFLAVCFILLVVFKPVVVNLFSFVLVFINCKTCGLGLIMVFYYIILLFFLAGMFCVLFWDKILRMLSKISTSKLVSWLIFALLTLLFVACFTRMYTFDEIYHAHPAWMVSTGMIPHVDFLQVHFPLYHVLAGVVIKLVGEHLFTLTILRLISFVNLLVLVWFSYKIFRIVFKINAKGATLFFSLTLLSLPVFTSVMIDIRPDVFMLSSFVVSLYFLMRYMYVDKKMSSLCLAGLFGGLSLLFLQKAVFVLIPLSVFLFRGFGKKHLVLFIRDGFIYYGSVIACFMLYIIYYAWIGKLENFIFFCFKFNLIWNAATNPFKNMLWFFLSNPVYWILGLILFITTFMMKIDWKKAVNSNSAKEFFVTRLSVFLIIHFLFVVLVMKISFMQYFMVVFWCVSMLLGVGLLNFKTKLGSKRKALLHVLLLLIVAGSLPYYVKEVASTNHDQKELYSYVLENVNESETVFDGHPGALVNTFRKDMDPKYWSVPMVKITREYFFHLPPYNITKEIIEHKPKIIYIKENLPRALCMYSSTPYEGVYILRESGSCN